MTSRCIVNDSADRLTPPDSFDCLKGFYEGGFNDFDLHGNSLASWISSLLPFDLEYIYFRRARLSDYFGIFLSIFELYSIVYTL